MTPRAEAAQAALPPVESIKAFDADLKCRGFQFEFGKTYKAQGEIEACLNGFHACEGNPLDVWSYYGPVDADGRLSRYGAVSQSGDLSRHGEDSKVASRVLSVKVELSLGEFVTRAAAWMVGAVKDATSNIQAASGAGSKLAASGAGSNLAASGEGSVVACSGPNAIARGAPGTWIALADYRDGKCVGFSVGCIGQDGLKPDTEYHAKDGKLVEVKQ